MTSGAKTSSTRGMTATIGAGGTSDADREAFEQLLANLGESDS